MKRKFWIAALSACMLAAAAFGFAACDDGDGTEQSDTEQDGTGLEYILNYDGTAYTVVGIGTVTDTDIVIPSTYNVLPVTGIGYYAFWDCDGLTSIIIPDSVTSIGQNAFEYCTELTSIAIPDSVTSIGDYAFGYCDGLTSITIPDGVTSIGSYAFYGCSGLTSIVIPFVGAQIDAARNTHFGYIFGASFSSGNDSYVPASLKTVTITGGTSIGDYAFENCSGLTSVTIPDSVTSIGGCAFYGCSGLTSITIPDSVTRIGSSAFDGCSGLTSVTIGNGVTSIGDFAFYNCDGLTSITIPNSVTSIGNQAFDGCSGLTSVYFTGAEAEWKEISIGFDNFYLTDATRYYYVENEADVPQDGGNYWHYDTDGVTPVAW